MRITRRTAGMCIVVACATSCGAFKPNLSRVCLPLGCRSPETATLRGLAAGTFVEVEAVQGAGDPRPPVRLEKDGDFTLRGAQPFRPGLQLVRVVTQPSNQVCVAAYVPRSCCPSDLVIECAPDDGS